MYNGSVSGSFKNAIDWLHLLGSRDPPYLHDQVIGLISAAGGTQGLQVVDTMEFSVRSLRGWAVPYVVPVPQAARVFPDSGEVQDDAVDQQLSRLGEEVVRVAERFARDPSLHRQVECDDAPTASAKHDRSPADRWTSRVGTARGLRSFARPGPQRRSAINRRAHGETALERHIPGQIMTATRRSTLDA